jgi:hypothetical protein
MPHRICRHIRPSGRRCQTPAVRDQALCYYHLSFVAKHNGDVAKYLHIMNTMPTGELRNIPPERLQKEPLTAQYYGLRPTGPDDLDLPPLEDIDSLQIALSTVLNALAQNRIETKRASILLYGLQLTLAALRTERPPVHAGLSEVEPVLANTGEYICSEPAELPGEQDPHSLATLTAKQLADKHSEDEEDEDDDDDDEDLPMDSPALEEDLEEAAAVEMESSS